MSKRWGEFKPRVYYATRDSGSACDEMVSMGHRAQMVDGIPSTLPKTRDPNDVGLGWVGEHWTRGTLVNGRDYPESLTLAHHALLSFPSLRLDGAVLHPSARNGRNNLRRRPTRASGGQRKCIRRWKGKRRWKWSGRGVGTNWREIVLAPVLSYQSESDRIGWCKVKRRRRRAVRHLVMDLNEPTLCPVETKGRYKR